LAKQQAVTQENLYVALLTKEDVDPAGVWIRPMLQALITESACEIFRGSRDGMLGMIFIQCSMRKAMLH
jgi:hypothetical protein